MYDCYLKKIVKYGVSGISNIIHYLWGKKALGFFVLAFWGIVVPLWASTAQMIEHVPDARSNAMGTAGVADSQGASSIFLNASGLTSLTDFEVAATFYNEWTDVNSGSMAFAMPFMNKGVLGLGLYSLHIGSLDLPDQENDPIAELDFILSVAYASRLNNWFDLPFLLSMGVTAKYFYSTLAGEYTGQAVAGDASLKAMFFDNCLSLGAALRNFGSPISYDLESERLPTSGVFGVTWSQTFIPEFGLTGSLDCVCPLEDQASILAGAEFRYLDMIHLRLGYQFEHDTTDLTAGFGVHWRAYTLDYAFTNNILAFQHMITLTYTAGTSVQVAVTRTTSPLTQKGIELFQQGQLLQAKECWQSALQENPDDVYAKKYLDQFEESRNSWINSQAVLAEQDFQETLYALAWEQWQALAAVSPDHPRVTAGMEKQRFLANSFLSKARSLNKQNDWLKALADVSEALKVIPQYAPALELQREIQDAMKRKQQSKDPSLSSQQTEQIRKLSQDGEPVKAFTLVKNIFSGDAQGKVVQEMLDKISQWSHKKALELKDRNHYQAAMDIWGSILTINPNYQTSREAYKKTSDYFHKTIEKGKAEAMAAFTRNDYDQAIIAWEKVYALDPEAIIRERLVQVYTAQGILAYRNDNLDLALSHWRKALAIDPENALLQKNIQRAKNKSAFIKKLGWEVSQ